MSIRKCGFGNETLHNLGLIDRYYERKFIDIEEDGVKTQRAKPHSGYEKSIMADSKDGVIIQDHYDDYGKAFANLEDGVYHLNYFIDALEAPADSDKAFLGSANLQYVFDKNGKLINLSQSKRASPRPQKMEE